MPRNRDVLLEIATVSFEDWVDRAAVPMSLKDIFLAGWFSGYKRACREATRDKDDHTMVGDKK
jgi:hypothetical protein